jgi:hypothetical protein
MSFANFGTGQAHAFGGRHLELVPHERIRYTDAFDDPDLPGEMTVTVILRMVVCGVEIDLVQEGVTAVFPGRDVPSRLAGIVRAAGAVGGAGDPQLKTGAAGRCLVEGQGPAAKPDIRRRSERRGRRATGRGGPR